MNRTERPEKKKKKKKPKKQKKEKKKRCGGSISGSTVSEERVDARYEGGGGGSDGFDGG